MLRGLGSIDEKPNPSMTPAERTPTHTLRADKRKDLRIAAHPMTTQFGCVTSRAGTVQPGRLSGVTYLDFYASARWA
jgi:hypothetical protein